MIEYVIEYVIIFVLCCILVTLLIKDYRAKKSTKNNSQVFHPLLTPIWRQAALDWAESEEDDRTFDTFLTDTIDIIMSRGRNG